MVRHLADAIAQLRTLPPRAAPYVAEDLDAPLAALLDAAWALATLGAVLPGPLLEEIAALWRHRPELRPPLVSFVGYYPCDELLRAARRSGERGDDLDDAAWLARYPELGPALTPHVIDGARRFNQPDLAVTAGLRWARYFGGGDEAWRAIALALKRQDRRTRRRGPRHFDAIRHDLEDHGRLAAAQALTLNRHLVALGVAPIEVQGQDAAWHAPGVDYFRAPRFHGHHLARLAHAERQFARDRWTRDDDRAYADALRALPADALASFRRHAPFTDTLARIEALAGGGAHDAPRPCSIGG